MWDLIVSVPDHCLSFYSEPTKGSYGIIKELILLNIDNSTPEKEEWKGCCSVGSRKGRGIQWSVYGCVQ